MSFQLFGSISMTHKFKIISGLSGDTGGWTLTFWLVKIKLVSPAARRDGIELPSVML